MVEAFLAMTTRHEVAWAVALGVVPAALGALGAIVLGRLGRRGHAVAVALACAAPLAALALAPRALPLSVYDLLFAALAFATASLATMALAARPGAGRGLALVLATTSFALAAAEAASSGEPSTPLRAAWLHEGTRPFVPLVERERACAAMFPDDVPGDAFPRMPSAPPRSAERPRRVVHLGDSMLEGREVDATATVTAFLEGRRPGEQHLNLGILNTGTDVELAVARKWLPRLRPDLVVVHVLVWNDVVDVDRPYLCTDDGPILDADRHERFATPRWRFTRRRMLRDGPSAFPLRLLAERSALVEQTLGFGVVARARLFEPPAHATATFARFASTLVALRDAVRDEGVRLAVVAVPVRPSLLRASTTFRGDARPHHEALVALAREAALPFFDALADFDARYADDPGAPIYVADPAVPHFDVEGHRLYAEWLDAHVLDAR